MGCRAPRKGCLENKGGGVCGEMGEGIGWDLEWDVGRLAGGLWGQAWLRDPGEGCRGNSLWDVGNNLAGGWTEWSRLPVLL